MRIELLRVGPSGITETDEKDLDGPIDSDLNAHRINVLQYGLVINPDRKEPGPCYNQEDPLWQCANTNQCSWSTYRVVEK